MARNKRRTECRRHTNDGFTGEAKKRELRGVVYMMNRSGPSTEPCGTPQESDTRVDL